jgi:hypothetical protein
MLPSNKLERSFRGRVFVSKANSVTASQGQILQLILPSCQSRTNGLIALAPIKNFIKSFFLTDATVK